MAENPKKWKLEMIERDFSYRAGRMKKFAIIAFSITALIMILNKEKFENFSLVISLITSGIVISTILFLAPALAKFYKNKMKKLVNWQHRNDQ